MLQPLRQWLLGAACLVAAALSTQQLQAQCASCTATLPSNIPADTIYLDSFPNAQKGVYYEEVANFRFPYTTTPLQAFDPTVPSGINLQSFTITAVNGLPLGLTWTGDQPAPMVYDETSPDTRDGCIRVCGTPQQSGTFVVNVSILVATGIVAPVAQNIPVTFIVDPDTSATFAMDTSSGCAPLTVTFTNRVQTLGNETWAYSWNFGDGTTSTDENPAPVTYTDSGQYNVSMRAVSTLALPRTFLSSVTVTAVSCTDPFGVVDLFLTVGSSASGTDTVTAFALNVAPPLITNFGTDIQLVGNTSYSIWVQDDDAVFQGLPGPADCGTVYFNSDTLSNGAPSVIFSLTNGGLTANVRLVRDTLFQRDTLFTEDIIVVTDCDTVGVTRYDFAEKVSLKAYPNPTSGDVTIEFELGDAYTNNDDIEVVVYDALGRNLQQQRWAGGQSIYQERLQLGGYSDGIYMVQIRIGNQLMNKRIIVRR